MKTGFGSLRFPITIGFLSGATLLLESGLIRYLAVAQYYHFAFLVISLALLGFGASGTLIAVFPRIKDLPLEKTLSWIGLGLTLSIWVTYIVVNWLPFDSYSIAWERRQLLFFVIYFFSISLPFLVSGLGLGTVLAVVEKDHHKIYAANLVGSGVGVLLAPLIMALSGVLGLFIICSLVCIGIWAILRIGSDRQSFHWSTIGLALVGLAAWISLVYQNAQGNSTLGFNISPYKGLAYARQYPGSKIIYGKWGRSSRIDVIESAGIHRLPGLSYAYQGEIPTQLGLTIDGDALQPITLVGRGGFEVGEWLPEWWALSLFEGPDVLILDPGGGFGIVQVQAMSPNSLTAVVPDPLLLEAVDQAAGDDDVYKDPTLDLAIDNPRAYLARREGLYDLIYVPLTDEYQPVSNGFYSISEDFSLTVEGFQAGLSRLTPGGVLVTSRWLQNPPSEGLRLVTTLTEAIRREGYQHPEEVIVVYRGIQTITAVVRPDGWDQDELMALRSFLDRSRFDLVWSPDVTPDEPNRWNRLDEPIYYQEINTFFKVSDSEAYYQAYPYNITPPTDDHPYYFHFFTWSQIPIILRSFGRTWQPFGGSGYLVLFFLLGLVVFLSTVLILVPLWIYKKSGEKKPQDAGKIFLYFVSIGIGFMFIEIPLISQWSLFLREPIYAFSLIIAVLLLSSGLGSRSANQDWVNKGIAVPAFFLAGGGFVIFTVLEKSLILAWPIWLRILAAGVGLTPLGFSLGTFFPRGLSWVKGIRPEFVPWAWAVNGSASVIASVLAAILALEMGFSAVLLMGGMFYIGAWLVRRGMAS